MTIRYRKTISKQSLFRHLTTDIDYLLPLEMLKRIHKPQKRNQAILFTGKKNPATVNIRIFFTHASLSELDEPMYIRLLLEINLILSLLLSYFDKIPE